MGKEKKKTYKAGKVLLKLKRAHKIGFRLGKHLIKMGAPKEYDLSKEEMKELDSTGPKHWIKVVTQEEMDALPKSNAENKKIQDLKKYFAEKEIEIPEEVKSLEDLQEFKSYVEMHEAVRAQLEEKGVDYDVNASLEELEALLSDSEEANNPA